MIKPNLYLILACLWLLSVCALAQETETWTEDDAVEVFMQRVQKATLKGVLRSQWNSHGTGTLFAIAIAANADNRIAYGISEEQWQQMQERHNDIEDSIADSWESDPEMSRMMDILINDVDENWLKTADEEEIEKMLTAWEGWGSIVGNVMDGVFDEFLTPEQLQKIQETQLANMAETPFLVPNALEALDLTDDQKQEMEQIKKELEPEFEAFLEEVLGGVEEWDSEAMLMTLTVPTDDMLKLMQKEIDALSVSDNSDNEDDKKRLEKLLESKKQFEEKQSGFKAFSAKYKAQMLDILSDEQRASWEKLIDDPPEHAKMFRKMIREMLGLNDENEGENEKETSDESKKPVEKPVWTPGPDSWQPGDGVPEGLQRDHEKGSFPRREEKDNGEPATAPPVTEPPL